MNHRGKLLWPMPVLVVSIALFAMAQAEVHFNPQEIVRVAGVLFTGWLTWISTMVWRLHGFAKQSRAALYGEGNARGLIRQVDELEPRLREMVREMQSDTRNAVSAPILQLEERIERLEQQEG